MIRDRRIQDDPVANVLPARAKQHQRIHPLSPEEFERLLVAARDGPTVENIPGEDRMILYLLAAYTGYRRGEIGSINELCFDFDSSPATLTVQPNHSKRGRRDVEPLRRDLAEILRHWISTKRILVRGDPLLPVSRTKTSRMIRTDLAAARSKWLDEAKDSKERYWREHASFLEPRDDYGRVVDFRSLRTTFITNLTRMGAAPRTVQLLARHSKIELTLNVYAVANVLDLASAVEALPPPPKYLVPESQAPIASQNNAMFRADQARFCDATQDASDPAKGGCLSVEESWSHGVVLVGLQTHLALP